MDLTNCQSTGRGAALDAASGWLTRRRRPRHITISCYDAWRWQVDRAAPRTSSRSTQRRGKSVIYSVADQRVREVLTLVHGIVAANAQRIAECVRIADR